MVDASLAVAARPIAAKDRLRLWIRLLRVSRSVEAILRERLKTEFDSTLPRFDVMAALARAPGGMVMSELSKFLLVSNGNVTVIVDRLVNDGHVVRATRDGDRRTSMVRLTSKGARFFDAMATAHERWVDELLCGIDADEARDLGGALTTFSSNWDH